MVKGEKPGDGKRGRFVCEICGTSFERYLSQLHPKGGGRFCSAPCQRKGTAEQRKRFGPEHAGWRGGVEYRKKALEAFGARCNACGYDAYPELLWVHHKNFKPRKEQDDHSLDNLEVLCVRCHLEAHLAFQVAGSTQLHVLNPPEHRQAVGERDPERSGTAEEAGAEGSHEPSVR